VNWRPYIAANAAAHPSAINSDTEPKTAHA